jgi:chorismate mutase
VADDSRNSRLEDTIIWALIERVQFPLNRSIYIPGAISLPDPNLSFMDWYLREQERLQSRIRRYDSPDEYPFFPEAVEQPILEHLSYPPILHPCHRSVNVNSLIKAFYTDRFLPAVCPDFGRPDRGAQAENYGSAATCDIASLQALSRRIHFGMFVAESKFQANEDTFTAMIRAGDREAISNAITKPKVEEQVLARLKTKAEAHGRDLFNENYQPKINVDAVVDMYRDFVIPLTKRVEVQYLMQRLS